MDVAGCAVAADSYCGHCGVVACAAAVYDVVAVDGCIAGFVDACAAVSGLVAGAACAAAAVVAALHVGVGTLLPKLLLLLWLHSLDWRSQSLGMWI